MSPQQIRKIVLEQSRRAGVGHIGCSLSVADVIACLYGGVMRIADGQAPERDRFILSKGHAALALYAALFLRGIITAEQLNSYCGNGTLLGVHPEHALRGVDFCTGSLGMGLSLAAGAALAARMQQANRRVFVLVSDAECNEGSTWEAVMFAAHHKLGNLHAILDLNGQQAFGHTKDVMDLAGMADRWRAFGWQVTDVDGHNLAELTRAFDEADAKSNVPQVVLANTVFGKGVSYMERQVKWHYWPMSDTEYQQALAEVGAAA